MSELNPFRIAQQQLDEAAAALGLDSATHEALRWPMREMIVTLTVRMDDGSVKIFRGYRVQYNDARGPTKGGLRFHPQETLDTVRALAAWMTWKTAVMDLPLGGGKGGVTCNPKEMSQAELERLSRAYVRQVGRILGPEIDVPAPDVNTTPQVMAWIMDEFSVLRGHNVPGVITGKPLALGGSLGRVDATARGGMYALREAAKVLNLNLNGATAAIQGYGNVGQNAGILAQQLFDMKILAVADEFGGIYNPKGIDPRALAEHVRHTGSVVRFPDTESITNEELLEMKVDVLFPAAIEGVITGANAHKIQARIVCELANGPTTPEADRILHDRGIFVLPDILANAGGVTVSYFEQVQNAYNFYWTLEEIHERLNQKMTKAFADFYAVYEKHKVHPRLAAYMVAVARVAEAMKLRGWV
ncbi:MAG: Glu/Leu/Phe/Val dehydrogenase [candidate division KSB1 bacterium]|nr:Glu/Leu/Phe/Val dehydrogenase [candidate division KSB1 bacterium]